jgi:galactitol-specific phosphotransferase system IIB component
MKILSDESQKRYNILSLKPIDGEKIYVQHSSSKNTTILKLDENLEKELYINNKIEDIPFYHLYFHTIHAKTKSQLSYVTSRSITPRQKKEEIPLEYWERVFPSNKNHDTNPKSNSFILIETSSNLTNSTSIHTYDEWLYKFNNKKELLSNIFNLCFFVLDGMQILKNHDILLLNFSKSNLCFNQFGKPFICQLKNCIEKSCLNNVSDYVNTSAPIEMAVFDYLKKNTHIHSLSNNQIDQIVKKYTDTHIIISNISIHMKEKYYEDSVKYLQVLTNKPFSYISEFLLKYVDSWDNYGFHIFYLKEILLNNTSTMSFITDDSKVFWKGFIDIFMKNILCNPNERHNIQESKNGIENYLYTKMKHLDV